MEPARPALPQFSFVIVNARAPVLCVLSARDARGTCTHGLHRESVAPKFRLSLQRSIMCPFLNAFFQESTAGTRGMALNVWRNHAAVIAAIE